MKDSLSFILDSTQRVINIFNPGKSYFEIYAPYVAVFVSLLTVFVNIWLNNRQIKNSHPILERNIEANRKNTIKNNKINFELKILEDFKDLFHKCYPLMKELYNFSVLNEEFDEKADQLFELFIKQVQTLGRIEIKIKEGNNIIESLFEFHQSLGVNFNSEDYETKLDKLLDQYSNESETFIKKSSKIILEQ